MNNINANPAPQVPQGNQVNEIAESSAAATAITSINQTSMLRRDIDPNEVPVSSSGTTAITPHNEICMFPRNINLNEIPESSLAAAARAPRNQMSMFPQNINLNEIPESSSTAAARAPRNQLCMFPPHIDLNEIPESSSAAASRAPRIQISMFPPHIDLNKIPESSSAPASRAPRSQMSMFRQHIDLNESPESSSAATSRATQNQSSIFQRQSEVNHMGVSSTRTATVSRLSTSILPPALPRFTSQWTFLNTLIECESCKAIMWRDEKASISTREKLRFLMCCRDGQVRLEDLPETPEVLQNLLNDTNFLANIRLYNSMFAFTSMGGKVDESVVDGRGPYTFRISGANYHQLGSLLPNDDCPPKFIQLYIHETHRESENRLRALGNPSGVNMETVELLQQMLYEVNPYIITFRTAREVLQSQPQLEFKIRIVQERNGRQYVQPTSDELAALVVGSDVGAEGNKDIIVSTRCGYLQRVFETQPSYFPMQYPLLFPHGTDGWGPDILYVDPTKTPRRHVTMREFYTYYIQYRANKSTILLRSGRLFQQFLVDVYVSIETCRLNYFRTNQGSLRTELYTGLCDAYSAGETDAAVVGKRLILPSTFTGGPRYMQQHYLDAMAICAKLGYPDFFITFTCNPHWPEVQEALSIQPGRYPSDRPDILARVFKLKLKELYRDLKDRKHFGEVVAGIQVIEFQKRGLPHAHILITLASSDKPNCAEDIDLIISAELPNKETEPLLFNTVTKHMIHGPCGYINSHSPCMVRDKCSKHYPKSFCDQTTIDNRGFIRYRRRRADRSVIVNNKLIDNRWVVPYNKDLCIKYDAHINVERCAQKKVIKYLHKYMHKGSDRATFKIEASNTVADSTSTNGSSSRSSREAVDEIAKYQDGRYISAVESCWRLFEFEITQRHPSVQMVQFHLPGEHCVVFRDNNSLRNVVQSAQYESSMLLGWFELNQRDTSARKYIYCDIPLYYVWIRNERRWKPRKRGTSIGRLPHAHPNAGERYYLRLLLTIVKGATSYADVRTYRGVVYNTFHEACLARGVIDDDSEWQRALDEASHWATGSQLRRLFCTILLFTEITRPDQLWHQFWKDLTDDIEHNFMKSSNMTLIHVNDEQIQNVGLREIENVLNSMGRSLKDFPTMPMPSMEVVDPVGNRLIFEQQQYNVIEERRLLDHLLPTLNQDQHHVFRAIMSAYDNNKGGVYFVYGSGGTGKTHLWKTLICCLRTQNKIVLSVASSGIAALLLPFGKTAHSTFKIPIMPNEHSICNFSKNSSIAELIRQTALIIWDEAPMAHRHVVEALDRTLRDMCDNTIEFGGKLIVFGGDFRQILPVVQKGTRADIVAATICKSTFWHKCVVMQLKINMRLTNATMTSTTRKEIQQFTDWILNVGNGTVETQSLTVESEPNWITIPDKFLIQNNPEGLNNLINFVYPDFHDCFHNIEYIQERCILAPTNNDVDELNALMLQSMPGEIVTYYSSDSFVDESTTNFTMGTHPTELFASINSSGFPSNILELKVGAVVVLLRNLDPSKGLCNGTRLLVEKLGDRIVECKIINGQNMEDTVSIPRVDLTPSSTDIPVAIKRRQFPLRLAFAMTINKSQGQTLKRVGVYLPKPVFSHGQLYVALSRVTSPEGIKLLICNKPGVPPNMTTNVVYPEVFSSIDDAVMRS